MCKAQPERETEVCNVETHRMDDLPLVGWVFPTGCSRPRLADGFFAALGEASVG